MLRHRIPLIVSVAAVLAVSTACSAPSQAPASSSPATAGTSATGWGIDLAGGADRVKAAGLQILDAEGTAEHYHAHLDVFVKGQPIPVPADIGFSFGPDGTPNGISALHTHDESGIVHIEAPTAGRQYTLGQVLTEWGVLDGSAGAGTPHGGTSGWTVYVNGSTHSGPVTDLVLKAHEEIVLSYGTPPSTVPSSFSFPAGL